MMMLMPVHSAGSCEEPLRPGAITDDDGANAGMIEVGSGCYGDQQKITPLR